MKHSTDVATTDFDNAIPLLETIQVSKSYTQKQGLWSSKRTHVHAVREVSLRLHEGETLGLVGESGCGKSTLGKLILRLIAPTAGQIRFRGQDISRLRGASLKKMRRDMQVVFQDPYATLNPRLRVGTMLREVVRVHRVVTKSEETEYLCNLLRQVGLHEDVLDRYPQAFSGGQRQRLGIARALALRPKLIIADEPTSALDVSIQAQVLNLLKDLQERNSVSFLFISHDLAVVRHLSHRVAVMYRGQIVEYASTKSVFFQPRHPYTVLLLASLPNSNLRHLRDTYASQIAAFNSAAFNSEDSACPFFTRCPHAEQGLCNQVSPTLREVEPDHFVACHHPESVARTCAATPVMPAQ